MATTLSRRLALAFLSNHYSKPSCILSASFSYDTTTPSSNSLNLPDADASSALDSDTELITNSSPEELTQQKQFYDRPLENGLDVGIYKAILVGQVGQSPFQKRLKSGRTVTMLSVGTGGIRNNRRPLDNETPSEYASRCAVQWHRVCVYTDKLGEVVTKHVTPGSLLYVEGNLESKVFNDPITGLVRRIREISIRRNGRVVFLGNGGDDQKSKQTDWQGVGYY